MNVSPEEWKQFSDEVAHALRLTGREQAVAWSTNLGVSALGFVVAPLAVAPGHFAGKAVVNRSVEKKVLGESSSSGEIEETLRRWNGNTFRYRGFRVRLQLPRKRLEKMKRVDENRTPSANHAISSDSERKEGEKSMTKSERKQERKSKKQERKSNKKAMKSERKQTKKLRKHYTVVIEDIRNPAIFPEVPNEIFFDDDLSSTSSESLAELDSTSPEIRKNNK